MIDDGQSDRSEWREREKARDKGKERERKQMSGAVCVLTRPLCRSPASPTA